MRSLCRFNDGNPIEISLNSTRDISCQKIESLLEDYLENTPDAPPFCYELWQDAGFLGCRKPKRPVESFLGILEHSSCESEDIIVSVNHFVSKGNPEPLEDSNIISQAPAPHSSWERHEIASQREEEGIKIIDLVDLRAEALNELSSGGAAHLLRSLLGIEHGSSPWTNSETNSTTQASTVILAVDSAPQSLLELRVNDACPSWYLLGAGRFSLPDTISFDGQRQSPVTDGKPCSLLIYRTLCPRDHISTEHPETGEKAKTGCLWETTFVNPPPEEEAEPYQMIRQVSPPYISHKEYGSLLDPLFTADAINSIEKEALDIAHWTAWPESEHYQQKVDGGPAPWNVFPLCYCFPATDVSARQWIPQTCALAPNTVSYLESLGDVLRTALFSRLDPDSVLEAHTGWEDLANHVIRLHVPLTVPPGGLCGTWVDGCVETHERGRPLLFDDSKTHRAFNFSKEDRIVLILDLVRPNDLPRGTATGGHSDELDKFIENMGI